MIYQVKTAILLYTIVLVIFVITASIVFFKSKKTHALYCLTVCQILVIAWMVLGINETLSSTQRELMINVRLTLTTMFILPSCWLVFSLIYCDYFTLKNKAICFFIMTPSLILSTIMLTNYDLVIVHKDISNPHITKWGIVFWMDYVLMIFCFFASSVIFIKKAIKEPKRARVRYYVIVGSTLIPFMVNILKMSGVIVEPKFIDFTLISFSGFFIIAAVTLNYLQFFEVMPYGHEFFNNLKEATLFIDENSKIIDYNNKIKENFGMKENLGDIDNFLNMIGFTGSESTDGFIKELKDTRSYMKYTGFQYNKNLHYDILVSPILDKRNKLVMKAITFYDITEFYNIQKENYKKTKQLENMRIKGDMHDKIGNIIVLIKSTLEIVLKDKLENSIIISPKNKSDKDKLHSMLGDRMNLNTFTLRKINDAYDKSREALELLREICRKIEINNYSSDDKRSIIAQLKEVFEKHETYGTIEKIHFTYEGDLVFNSYYTEEILLICTEALTNSIKHGEAKNVYIILKNEGNNVMLRIIDDGKGCNVIKKLVSIENRVLNINGKIQYQSDVGTGFYISITIPYTEDCYKEVLNHDKSVSC